MPLRSDWSEELCPIRRALNVVGDPWTLLIIRDVLHGRGRFDTLRDNLRISEAVLSRRLQDLIHNGLLLRVPYQEANGRTRSGYAGTAAAAELLPVLQQLAIWGEEHTVTPAAGSHMAMIHKTCGGETRQGQICSECGKVMVPEEMTWVKPWIDARDDLVPAGVLRTD